VFRTDNISCLLPSSAIARALARDDVLGKAIADPYIAREFTVHGVGASPAVLAALGRRAPPSFDPARLGERCARGSRALERAADLDGPVVPGGRRRQAREAIHEIRPPSVEPSELGLSNVRGIDEYRPFPVYMPLPDASFDAVLSFWSLNHAMETSAVIGEAARVLRTFISLADHAAAGSTSRPLDRRSS